VYTCNSFKKYFYVSLGNNFSTVFLWRPLSCGGPWATAQFPPPLNPALRRSVQSPLASPERLVLCEESVATCNEDVSCLCPN